MASFNIPATFEVGNCGYRAITDRSLPIGRLLRRAPHRPAALTLELMRSPFSDVFYHRCIADRRLVYQPRVRVLHRSQVRRSLSDHFSGRDCSFW